MLKIGGKKDYTILTGDVKLVVQIKALQAVSWSVILRHGSS